MTEKRVHSFNYSDRSRFIHSMEDDTTLSCAVLITVKNRSHNVPAQPVSYAAI